MVPYFYKGGEAVGTTPTIQGNNIKDNVHLGFFSFFIAIERSLLQQI
jgi:hypothetical protein